MTEAEKSPGHADWCHKSHQGPLQRGRTQQSACAASHHGHGLLRHLHPQPPAHSPTTCCRAQCCPHTHFTCLLTVRVKWHLLHRQLSASVSIIAEVNFPKSSSSKQLPQPPVHWCLQGCRKEERVERRAQQGDFSIRVRLTLQNAHRACSDLTREGSELPSPRGTTTKLFHLYESYWCVHVLYALL